MTIGARRMFLGPARSGPTIPLLSIPIAIGWVSPKPFVGEWQPAQVLSLLRPVIVSNQSSRPMFASLGSSGRPIRVVSVDSIRPVNPRFAGSRLHERDTVATLAELTEPTDVIEIFRRPEYLPGHADEILALPWRPKTVWFQLGIRNDAAAEKLARTGIRVVQDRCMMPEHRRLASRGL